MEKSLSRRTLAEIQAQHAMLRGMLERCETLADELDAGRCGPLQLTREVTRLRLAFDAHNNFEEAVLRPLFLVGLSSDSAARSVAAHVESHRVMRAGLASEQTGMLRDVIASMRDHLDAEEQFLATAQTLQVSVPA